MENLHWFNNKKKKKKEYSYNTKILDTTKGGILFVFPNYNKNEKLKVAWGSTGNQCHSPSAMVFLKHYLKRRIYTALT